MGSSMKSALFLAESRLADAARGDGNALYDLGISYQTGTAGVAIDLIEAHKWFNLAAVSGNHAAQECRAQIAEDMSPRDIAVAQRAARDWMQLTQRRAA